MTRSAAGRSGDTQVHTIPGVWERAARRFPDRIAYAAGDRTVTWGQIHREAVDFAAGLVALGLRPGDRLAIVAENSVEWIVACVGALSAGAVVVPIYCDLKPAEIREQIGRTECRFIVASGRLIASLPPDSDGLERLIVITGKDGAGARSAALGGVQTMAFGQVAAAATSESREALARQTPGPDALAAVIFTSGTTGGAKGVMLSHRNFIANVYSVLKTLDVSESDSVLVVLPLHHAMPFIATVVLVPLVGARAIIENDVRRLRERLAADKPTIFFGVPALYELMERNLALRAEAEGRGAAFHTWRQRVARIKGATGVNLGPLVFRQVHRALGGRLRFLVSGGAALKPATARAFFSLGLPLIQGWGMTEASPAVAIQRFSALRFGYTRYYENHAGSVGPAVPGVEVMLSDVPEKGIMVSEHGEGEVLVRGENVFRGYWEAPAETAQAMSGDWLRTGDLATIDSAGNIYLTGRSKYIIVLDSGEKVYPDEVEDTLSESSILHDVCVLDREARGKTQVGVVVYPDVEATLAALAMNGDQPSEENVRRIVSAEVERLNREVAAFKRVTQILLADAPLPKTPLQKVARGLIAGDYEFSLKRWQESVGEPSNPV